MLHLRNIGRAVNCLTNKMNSKRYKVHEEPRGSLKLFMRDTDANADLSVGLTAWDKSSFGIPVSAGLCSHKKGSRALLIAASSGWADLASVISSRLTPISFSRHGKNGSESETFGERLI
jgi:hypothetical protein